MNDDENMANHLNRFNISEKLTGLKIVISDDSLTILLLSSVPNTFDNFRCAVEARDDFPTSESLKIKLLNEYNAGKGQDRTRFTRCHFAQNRLKIKIINVRKVKNLM